VIFAIFARLYRAITETILAAIVDINVTVSFEHAVFIFLGGECCTTAFAPIFKRGIIAVY